MGNQSLCGRELISHASCAERWPLLNSREAHNSGFRGNTLDRLVNSEINSGINSGIMRISVTGAVQSEVRAFHGCVSSQLPSHFLALVAFAHNSSFPAIFHSGASALGFRSFDLAQEKT